MKARFFHASVVFLGMRFVAGLDLGQSYDHSALAVVEASDGLLKVRYLERAPLGTPYTEVLEWVRAVLTNQELRGRCALVVDGTGVGAPVVDMLRAARLGCEITDVRITSGGVERDGSEEYNAPRRHVPKRDLMAGLQLAFESATLRIAKDCIDTHALVHELGDMKMTYGRRGVRMGAEGYGQHDDLVIALALAVWRLRRKEAPKINLGGGRLF